MQQDKAHVGKIRQWSPIWIVPIAAVLIGLWMLYTHYQQQGAMLTLVATDAEGVIAGKTTVKNRSVDIGHVSSVELSDDLKQVIIKVRMKPSLTPLLNSATQFWVVKPQVNRAGVSGLSTLLSGAYIEMQAGEGGESKRQFELLSSPPVAPSDAPGLRVSLIATEGKALVVGDPVLYRGYDVGIVEQSQFNIELRRTEYQLYIRPPFDSLVTENVRFWLSSGFSVDLSAEGLQVDVGSVASILSGGVSFDVIEGWPSGNKVIAGKEFSLYPNKQSIQDGFYNEYVEYLLFFDESVRGLKSGAPVEYRGIRVGTVTSVPYFFSIDKSFEVSMKQGIPVLIRIEAGRLYENVSLKELKDELKRAVDRGLSGKLATGNLLSGSLYIDLELITPTERSEEQQLMFVQREALSKQMGYPMMSTVRGGFSNIEQKVLMALDKINNLPIETLLAQGEKTLQSTDSLMQNSAMLVAKLEELVASPQLQQLPEQLQLSLLELQKVLSGLSPGSVVYDRLDGNLQNLDQVLKDLQPVLQMLNQKSNALIFEAKTADDPTPKRAQ